MNTKSILIINGHPNPDSLNYALANAYAAGAERAGARVELLHLHQLQFNMNLGGGYKQRTEWEPDLEMAWQKIQEAEHLVWIHPVWWGGLPALMKGFIDRLFLPGFAFKYRENSVWWDKLLSGKTARIICTLDQPYWYYRWINGAPGIYQLKKMTLEFCGIKPVSVTAFGPVRNAPDKKINSMIEQTKRLALRDIR